MWIVYNEKYWIEKAATHCEINRQYTDKAREGVEAGKRSYMSQNVLKSLSNPQTLN